MRNRTFYILCIAALSAVTAPAVRAHAASPTDASDPPVAANATDEMLAEMARKVAVESFATTHPATPAVVTSATTKPDAASQPTTHPAPVAALLDPRESMLLGASTPTAKGKSPAPPATGDGSFLLNTLTSLGVVVLLILLLKSIILKWTGRPGGINAGRSPVLEVLSRVTIAPRNHVLLVRLGHRILVVGDSATGMRTLANIRDPDEVAMLLSAISSNRPGSISGGFAQIVQDFSGDHRTASRRLDRDLDEGADEGEARVDRARDGVAGLLTRVRGAAVGDSEVRS